MNLITQAEAKLIRKELTALLEQYNQTNAHGLTVALGNASFSDHQITFSTTAITKIEGTGDIKPSKEAGDFLTYAEYLGLSKDDLGKPFSASGREFKLCGYKPRSTKYPFLGQDDEGNVYKFTSKVVLSAFNAV
ncbi:hypothetical protein [Shewanella aestuarii]|uniref:Uncharacterized protein n=1 Tax=Shewanella aestuarii TaxID=1028752 RepID=A0A6G9QRA7_9GAMM|nr:hypothetical protein [Shewanella aestuarii]QIR16633.1 hypothetical protein HBH39_19345 [Shewanella aestuarii]